MRRAILLAVALAALAGCNTVAGLGEDVAGGARTVQGWLN
jgi:predicted small secreted protein